MTVTRNHDPHQLSFVSVVTGAAASQPSHSIVERRTRPHGDDQSSNATVQRPWRSETIPTEPTLTLATCAPGFTTLHNSHIEGHPHSPGRSGTEFAAQLVRPRPRPNNLAASTGNCRKSSPRRCRVPLVDKGRQGKVDKLAARRGEFDSR